MLGNAFNAAKGYAKKAQQYSLQATDGVNKYANFGIDKTSHTADLVEKLTRDHDLPPVEIKNSADSAMRFVGEELDAGPGTAVRYGIGRVRNALKAAGIILKTTLPPIGKILRPIHTPVNALLHPIDNTIGLTKWALRPLIGTVEIARSIATDTLQSAQQVYERGIVRPSQHLNKIVSDTRSLINKALSPIQMIDAKFA